MSRSEDRDDDPTSPQYPAEHETAPPLPPLPPGAPADLRDRLALALNTRDPAILAAAEEGYRGVYVSIEDYICRAVGWDIPRHLEWILDYTIPEKLRAGYENGAIAVWEIASGDGRKLVFESLRAGVEPFEVPYADGRITVFARQR